LSLPSKSIGSEGRLAVTMTDNGAREGCPACRANRGELMAPSGVIYQDALWRLERSLEPISMVGWRCPRRSPVWPAGPGTSGGVSGRHHPAVRGQRKKLLLK
jgi:hypothetical protein